jgi:hypothetical protein
MFQSAGLPLNLVVSGLSEVATFLIANNLKLKAKSCIRSATDYCENCYKCYRRYATLGIKLPSSKSISYGILKRHHLNILDYAYTKYGIKFYQGATKKNLLFLEKWYPKSLDLIVPKYRELVQSNISKLVQIMNEEDIILLENYKL